MYASLYTSTSHTFYLCIKVNFSIMIIVKVTIYFEYLLRIHVNHLKNINQRSMLTNKKNVIIWQIELTFDYFLMCFLFCRIE